eukprot:14887242-Alexandrium_andersonii.AAC.1
MSAAYGARSVVPRAMNKNQHLPDSARAMSGTFPRIGCGGSGAGRGRPGQAKDCQLEMKQTTGRFGSKKIAGLACFRAS